MKKKKVFIYVRVSTQEQARDGYSIGEQIDRLTKYCEAMGWIIVKVYTDAGHSGADTDRPALKAMIREVKAGNADSIVVYKLDRLSRSQKDTLMLIEDVLLKNDTDFVSMTENFDTSTPFGRAMVGILAVFAQLEREQIKERMTMGKFARAKEGKFGGSWAVPIGYNYIPEKDELVVNEYERMQVEQIFEWFLSGVGIKTIEKDMNKAGHKHKHGKWHDKTIRNVLRSRTYLGYIKYRKQWYKGSHTPFITEEMHDKVIEILADRKDAYVKRCRRGKVRSYLGGLLHCKHCDGKYSKIGSGTDPQGKPRDYYSCYSRHKRSMALIKDPNCKNKIWRMRDLDSHIFDEIRKLATDPEYFDKIKEEKQEDTRPQLINDEIEKLDNQMAKLMDFYTLGNMPLDMVEKRINELTEQKDKLKDELDAIHEEQKRILSKEETYELVQSFGDILDRNDFGEIRATLEDLIDYIVLDNDQITIHWNFA